ncbi:hypothetical protein LPTSP4_01120 [Leptospira ryugenii]|uniref:Tetratricopeptide repeat protein n=2 Tax=Leptospira ryugenii TaxID=1917863 RepID=A0A2P2DVF3_9LEPT|nr:hypothetical protein LPTSP4_01120 [Leptospira ryugenii]
MRSLQKTLYVYILCISFGIQASPIEDWTTDDILKEVRVSRIPQIIDLLEEKAKKAVQAEDYQSAKEYLKKALVLKHSIGMKHTEGSASILSKISHIETKLGNRCEASKLSSLAKRIYRQIGVNFGAVSFEEGGESNPKVAMSAACQENLSYVRD